MNYNFATHCISCNFFIWSHRVFHNTIVFIQFTISIHRDGTPIINLYFKPSENKNLNLMALTRRIAKETQRLLQDPVPGISATPDESNARYMLCYHILYLIRLRLRALKPVQQRWEGSPWFALDRI